MDFENQKMLENLFNDQQTPKLLRKEMLACLPVIDAIEASGLDHEFALDLLGQMALYKRAHPTTLIGLLKSHFGTAANPFQACADALQQAVQAQLVYFDAEDERFILRFEPDASVYQLIRQYQYLPPMVVPPLEVDSNRGSGYLTIRTDSLLLKNNHHEGDLCLDSINRFNRIPLSVNIDLVKRIRNSWKGLDKAKPGETFEEWQKRVKAFERYERDSFFTIALMHQMGNRFHLTHKPDKRGRTYSQGYHINYQGNCWNKACVELAEPELIV